MLNTNKKWTIIELINWISKQLSNNNFSNSYLEAEWLLIEVLKCKRIDLHINYNKIILNSKLLLINKMLQRRLKGEPFQHIIGKANFYGRDFYVNSNVLIPRPETELLIERLSKNTRLSSLLDVGSGSGCIAITCYLENLANHIFASEISIDAIKVLKKNLNYYKINNINLLHHDILNMKFNKKFDIIVSNPPYINKSDYSKLNLEVKKYDPKIALTDNNDGLSFYKNFSTKFDDLINDNGYMILEIAGDKYKESIKKIFDKFNVKFYKDLQNNYRAIEIRK